MNLGQTIRFFRKKRGYKQNEFAEQCHMSQTYLSQIENNQKEPNLSTLKEISRNLEIALPILFFLSIDEEDISKEKREIFKIISPTINKMIHSLYESDIQ